MSLRTAEPSSEDLGLDAMSARVPGRFNHSQPGAAGMKAAATGLLVAV